MAAFDIFVNGKQICTMTGEETGQLQAQIDWFRGVVRAERLPIGKTEVVEILSLARKQIDSAGYPCDLPRLPLKAGDEVTVRIGARHLPGSRDTCRAEQTCELIHY